MFDTGFICYYRGWQDLRDDDLETWWEHFVLNEIMARSQSRGSVLLAGQARARSGLCHRDPPKETGSHRVQMVREQLRSHRSGCYSRPMRVTAARAVCCSGLVKHHQNEDQRKVDNRRKKESTCISVRFADGQLCAAIAKVQAQQQNSHRVDRTGKRDPPKEKTGRKQSNGRKRALTGHENEFFASHAPRVEAPLVPKLMRFNVAASR
jgi:hypothetical protein